MADRRGGSRRDMDSVLLRIYRRGWVPSKTRHHIDALSVVHDFKDRRYAELLLKGLAREGMIHSAKYPVLTKEGLMRALALFMRRMDEAVLK